MWKNTIQTDRPQMTIWRKRTACWIPKATDTHSQYVMLLAFPLQQWLHDRFSMLRYTYIAYIASLRFWQQWWKFPSFLGYCTALTGKMLLMFRRSIVPLSSGLSIFLDCLTLNKTALGSWQKSINIHQSSMRNIPADLTLQRSFVLLHRANFMSTLHELVALSNDALFTQQHCNNSL